MNVRGWPGSEDSSNFNFGIVFNDSGISDSFSDPALLASWIGESLAFWSFYSFYSFSTVEADESEDPLLI